MLKTSESGTKESTEMVETSEEPRCLSVSRKGIRTGDDFANYMSAMMSDLVEGRITPNVGNAACNAGGKLLKVVEMKYKYGTEGRGTGNKTLTLAIEEKAE